MGYYNGNGFISAFVVRLIAALTIIIVIMIGVGLGFSLALTANTKNNENFVEFAPALPTRLLDINGNLITEFASDEKRELVALSELPRHLIHAVLAREDPDFYNHRGFSIRAIGRAVWGQFRSLVFGSGALGGGSTITQQVAGTLYTNRTERTVKRKIKELWWAFQMERRFTKNEILEIYLNYMPMGPGTYGVEVASKYFFKKSAREVDLAEAAVLAVLLSGPTRFDPLRNPNLARNRQHFVLERMIQFGYANKDEAEASFNEYWENFDWTQPALSAYLTREDKAPWFSEYVRRELDVLMYGTRDYYRDGYVVYTTLNLEHQEAAQKYVSQGLEVANREYSEQSRRSNTQAIRSVLPIVEMLTLVFDLTDIRAVSADHNEARAVSRYTRTINPIVDMTALMFGIPELKEATGRSFAQLRESTEQNMVEGALITIENETGYITAIIGGSKYDESNQLIRATQASIQPGSAFKPLYYSAAIDSRQFTTASMIYDIPMAFHNEDGTPYVPNNYGGAWRGPMLLYNALALSLNIPSLKILEVIGFDAAISRAAALLDITDEAQIRRQFPRFYPLGLGVNSTSPLRMARAFSIFGNQGRVVTPIAIRTIEDRNGRVIFDVERDIRQQQRRMANNGQIISQQNAYIMSRLMEFGVQLGTLFSRTSGGAKFTYRNAEGREFRMPMGGKTGTTQNWSDAWVVGLSPYYTTAAWLGFDKPGNSMGVFATGERLVLPFWSDYMYDIHRGLPQRNFSRPAGVIEITVCRGSGLLMTETCQGGVTLPFLDGTTPGRYCDLHGGRAPHDSRLPITSTQFSDLDSTVLDDIPRIQLDWDLFPELQQAPTPAPNQNNRSSRNNNQRVPSVNISPFLDDDPIINNPPVNNPPADIPGNIPDTPVLFIPREDDIIVVDDSEDDHLPPWNQVD
ncbi:MAG: PBP1A family penicillin-binding protein [Treponema sp.]|nr:PBP1A family penicillin-binding protein [Treponema sp.]